MKIENKKSRLLKKRTTFYFIMTKSLYSWKLQKNKNYHRINQLMNIYLKESLNKN